MISTCKNNTTPEVIVAQPICEWRWTCTLILGWSSAAFHCVTSSTQCQVGRGLKINLHRQMLVLMLWAQSLPPVCLQALQPSVPSHRKAVTGSQEPPDPLSQERFWISAPNVLWASLGPLCSCQEEEGVQSSGHGLQLGTPVIHSSWRAIWEAGRW